MTRSYVKYESGHTGTAFSIGEIVGMYEEGLSYRDIAVKIGVPLHRVSYMLSGKVTPRKAGGGRAVFRTKAQREEIVERYQNGESQSSLAMYFSCTNQAIWTALKKEGVPVRGPNEACGCPYVDRLGRDFWMRSTWEVKFAMYLDQLNLTWEYEIRKFDLGYEMTYLPDFWIYNSETLELQWIIDVKGIYRSASKKRVGLFRSAYPEYRIMILEGPHLMDLGILPRPKKRLGKRKPSRYSQTMNQRIIYMYVEEGLSTVEIGRRLGIGARRVGEVVKTAGVIRSKAEGWRLAMEKRRARKCSVEGCDKAHYGKGLCSTHWQRFQKNGSFETKNSKSTPELEEAILKEYAEGKSAYKVAEVLGTTSGIVYRVLRDHNAVRDASASHKLTFKGKRNCDRECSVEGCGKAAFTAGMCNAHYLRYKNHGSSELKRPVYGDKYDDEILSLYKKGVSCKDIGSQLGISAKPVTRVLKQHGVLRKPPSNEGKTCYADGCSAGAATKGLCSAHYQRLRRTGKVEGIRKLRNPV